LKILSYLSEVPKPIAVLTGLLLSLILGVFDVLTGPDISFLVFYLIPIFYVTWFGGRNTGIAIAVLSAIVWSIAYVIGARSYSHVAVPIWNVTETLVVYTGVACMLSALKRVEEQKTEREMDLAKGVQAQLFPQTLPPLRNLEYAGTCKPARGISGDYYDFVSIEQEKLALVVGDVVGKGISAALLMANLQGLVRSYAPICREQVDQLMASINRSLCSSTDPSRFATIFYGLYDDAQRKFTYVNAGHNPPLLFRDGGLSRLDGGNLAAGISPEASFGASSVSLQKDDIIVILTDGITEAMNLLGEQFGEQRVVTIVGGNRDLSPSDLCNLILAEVSRFAGQANQSDDATIVVAKAK
jgi:serine phosphatase RsbU (regulator of sigma subunit)